VVIGPGIITAVADNDAGGIATYSVAASLFGYASLFLVLPMTLLLAITQEVGIRIAIVAQKGLGDLIRENFGIRWTILIFTLLFITNQAVVIQNIAGLRASLTIFNIPYLIFLPLIIALICFFLIKGSYKTIQKGFLFLVLFYFSYVFSAVRAHPDWKMAFLNTLWPQETTFSPLYIFTLIAVLGTTITAWGQFFIHSYVLDKRLDIESLKFERFEVYLGAFITNFFSFMIMVAVAATLFKYGIVISKAEEAALAIRPFAGDLAFVFFSLGLFVASILGASIVPLSTAYAFSEFFGFERSLDKSFSQSKIFYTFLIIQLVIGFFAVSFPNSSLFKITLYADFLNGAMLPLIFFFLIRFANSDELLGKHKNSSFQNLVLYASAIVIGISVVFTIISRFVLKLG